MLVHHKNLAIETGVDPNNILILDNGDVAALTDKTIRLAGKVQADDVYIDGTGIGDIGSAVIRERKILSEEGMFGVILTIDSKERKLLTNPTIVSRGFIYMRGNEEITAKFAKIAGEAVQEELKKQQYHENNIKQKVVEVLEKSIYENTLRKPIIIPIVSDLSQS